MTNEYVKPQEGNKFSDITKPVKYRKTIKKLIRKRQQALAEGIGDYCEPDIPIDKYCLVVADWLRRNETAIVVLDFFMCKENWPLQYRLEEVLEQNHPAILAVLAERILSLSLQGRLNGTVAKPMLSKKFNLENSIQVTNGEMVFKFGE